MYCILIYTINKRKIYIIRKLHTSDRYIIIRERCEWKENSWYATYTTHRRHASQLTYYSYNCYIPILYCECTVVMATFCKYSQNRELYVEFRVCECLFICVRVHMLVSWYFGRYNICSFLYIEVILLMALLLLFLLFILFMPAMCTQHTHRQESKVLAILILQIFCEPVRYCDFCKCNGTSLCVYLWINLCCVSYFFASLIS